MEKLERLLFGKTGLDLSGQIIGQPVPWRLGHLIIIIMVGHFLPALLYLAPNLIGREGPWLTLMLLIQPLFLIGIIRYMVQQQTLDEQALLFPNPPPWLRIIQMAFIWTIVLRLTTVVIAILQMPLGLVPEEGNNPLLVLEDPATWEIVTMIIAAGILIPIAEEILYRGILYRFAGRYLGLAGAAILSSLVWAVMHGTGALILPLSAVGILLVLLYESTGTLWAPIAAHVGFNVSSFLLILLFPHVF